MLKTELEFRKYNEKMFLEYLKGIRTNAYKDKEASRRRWAETAPLTDIELNAYALYVRYYEKLRTINMIIDAYERIINGGVIDEKDPLFK